MAALTATIPHEIWAEKRDELTKWVKDMTGLEPTPDHVLSRLEVTGPGLQIVFRDQPELANPEE